MKYISRLLGIVVTGFPLVILLATTGCTTRPRYQTTFNLSPPNSIQGRQCTTQCKTNKLLCEQNEQNKAAHCEQRVQEQHRQCKRDAEDSYRSCMQEAADAGKYRAVEESSCQDNLDSHKLLCRSINDDDCEPAGQCGGDYRACFSNCGGVVKKKVVCVANCGKQ